MQVGQGRNTEIECTNIIRGILVGPYVELMKTQERKSITKEGQNLVASDFRSVYNKAHVCDWQLITRLKLCN